MEKTQDVNKRPHWRWLSITIGVIFMSIVLSGCGTLQTLVQKDGEPTPLSQWIGSNEQTVPATTNLGDGKAVSLYFPDSTGKALVKEERTLPKTLSVARETITEWLKGPAQGKGQAAVAPTTTLLDIAVKDGVATVDLSKEFTEPVSKVSQEMTVYGLVNTLTQFPTVHQVKIKVEGKPLTKLGNLDLSKLSYKEGFVKDTATPSAPAGSSGSSGTSSNKSGVPSTDVKAKSDSPSLVETDSPKFY